MDIVIKCHSLEAARDRAVQQAEYSGGMIGPHNRVRVVPNSFGAGPIHTSNRVPLVSLMMGGNGAPHYRVDLTFVSYVYTCPAGTDGPSGAMERDEAEALGAAGYAGGGPSIRKSDSRAGNRWSV